MDQIGSVCDKNLGLFQIRFEYILGQNVLNLPEFFKVLDLSDLELT